MRKPLLCAWVVLSGAICAFPAFGDDPSKIVIRPKGNSAATPDETRGGKFLVIKPQKPGEPAAPSRGQNPMLETPLPGSPKPSRGGDPVPTPVPVPEPAPQAQPDAKPADDKNEESGRIIHETWDTAFIKGHKIGYFHVKVRESEKNGKTFVYATKEQRLTVKRFGQLVEQWAEDATLEDPDGNVLVVRMRQGLSKEQMLAITGQVQGETLRVQGEGPAAQAQDIPWAEGVIGIASESRLYRDRKPKPGQSFDYLYYEGRLNRVVKITITAEAQELVAIVQGQPPTKMIRLKATMEPIGNFKLPASTIWCDAETYEPLRTDTEMPSLGGKLIVLRTTKEVALRPVGNVPDLFDVQSIRLDRPIPSVHDQEKVVYNFKVESDGELATLLPQDSRQALADVNEKAGSFALTVQAVRAPQANTEGQPAGEEYLSKSFFIDWDNEAVQKHSRSALSVLPATASDWERAKAIERWVQQNMKAVEFSQAMASASETARTLSGDCTEYAMLAVGMCRAAGIPSRTALGLVYAPGREGKPFLAYHMWFEVYVGGQWVALDATLGRGSVGPGHVKITDASWDKERSFAPLLPVLRVLSAQPKVEVGPVSGNR